MSIEMPQIKRLFMMLHGMYGNLLLDKFRTGQLDESGHDKGILSAQAVWLHSLQGFDFDVIRAAVGKCGEKHKAFPPSLPGFQDLCKAACPRHFSTPDAPKLAMSDELKAEIRKRNQLMLEELKLKKFNNVDFGTGLQALLLMVAKSIGDAGGDEVKTLLALESNFKAGHK